MVAGTGLEYGNSSALKDELVDALQSEYEDVGAGYAVPGISGKNRFENRICKKVSATAPTTDLSTDYANCVGDICIHYNASGVYQDLYVATDLTLTAGVVSACTWTVLAVA